MDEKALAKSKRAHSLHHSKKHHPNPKLKAPLAGPVAANTAKKPSGKQVREKSHQSQGSSGLPSNWDRYEGEDVLGSVDPSHTSMVQANDVIVPKSKGADYSHLISEAKSQSQTNNYSESFPSIDDVLADFNQGFSDLLSVRGQGILSCTGDDNFIVEDRATSSHEQASFLSLNLHHLAEQLSKVDLSQRLFIEADFMPLEMCREELKTSLDQESDHLQPASQSEGMKQNSDGLLAHGCHGRDMIDDHTSEFMPPVSSGIRDSVSTSCFQGLQSSNQAKNELCQSGETSESIGKYRAQSNAPVANPKKKSSRFEVAAAEAELDMLFDSFSETRLSDSSGLTKTSSYTFSDQQETSSRFEGNSFLKQASLPQPSRKEPDLSKPTSLATNFDDALDDLLKETSSGVTFAVPQEETSTSLLRGAPLRSAPVQPLRNGPDLSKKSASVMANFDDALDDLLMETSNLTNQKSTSQSHEVMPAHLKTMSSASSGPAPKSKALDDFDSWFDTV